MSPGVDVDGMIGACGVVSIAQTDCKATHSNLLALDRGPVHALEPAVVLDPVCAVVQVPETFAQVGRQEAFDEILGDKVDVGRKAKLAVQDLLVDPERVVVEEGRVTGKKLKEKHAVRPVVGGAAVARCGDAEQVSAASEGVHVHLGREILGGAAERVRAVGNVLGEPKVRNLDVALSGASVRGTRAEATHARVDEQILGLEVAVDDVCPS